MTATLTAGLPGALPGLVTALPAAATVGQRFGMIAGAGRFPVAVAEAAKRQGRSVVVVAVRDHTDGAALAGLVERIQWVGLCQMGRAIGFLRRSGVSCAVMAGKIHKVRLLERFRFLKHLPDLRTLRFAYRVLRAPDTRDDRMLLAVIDEFAKDGIRMASALEVCPELLIPAGVATRRPPTAAERRDVAVGWAVAKGVAGLDIGQTVAVKERTVLAVEAVEGTDAAIRRAGDLCPKGGFAVVKVAKPAQDVRFDVPTVGVDTVRAVAGAGGRVLAVEAGRTILLDAAATLALADELGITVIALGEGGEA